MKLTVEQRKALIEAARRVRGQAYVPYSHYPVGAALLGESDRVYLGVNVENAAYPLTMCAERSAVFQALAQGERRFKAIAVVTENGGAPCGACRQVLSEFGLEIEVFVADEAGDLKWVRPVAELLPASFGPQDLPHGAV